ncbi:hypothetical protein SAMN06269301_0462 [Geobacter sp. DSM 9736]|nr:hypothetical protein SAMN06269301_0462 [Geobacter sp. DSM 9736]
MVPDGEIMIVSDAISCSASIVIFNNPPHMILNAVESFSSACGFKKLLYVIANSPTPALEHFLKRLPITWTSIPT